ncbi:MAG: PEP-CTERM sorting domain-containing protein [Acidobacteriota bacterium]|nr:PEP-CTERM sorting domain-containing protein [Acidobacteriota bacterium]
MKRVLCALSGVVAFFAVSHIASANTINVSTGQDGSGNILASGNQTDANWTVTGADSETGTNAAKTVFPSNVDFCTAANSCAPAWVANNSSSDWIAFNPNSTANGAATYTTTFNLTGADLSTASLSGFWSIDDQGTLILNGHVIGTLSSSSQPWTLLNAFSVATGSSDFVAGINTLTMQITSSDNFEEGVRLNGTVSFTPATATPEPSSFLLCVSGAMVLAAALRRKKLSGIRTPDRLDS